MPRKTTKLVAFLVTIWIGALVWNYFWRDTWTFAFTAAIFIMGITTFVGVLNISRDLRGTPGTFEDGDVRLAVTCTFVILFLTLLSFFTFATNSEPGPFAETLIREFLVLTALIIGFYFATSGSIEFLKIRERQRAGRTLAAVAGETEEGSQSA